MQYRYEMKTNTPLGTLTLIEQCQKIICISYFLKNDCLKIPIKKTAVLEQAEKELLEYFEGIRKQFTFPILPKGTEFQKKVWQALQKIPYGEKKSYGEIAKEINSPKASRAVGNANHVNPIAIVIPCHRVIGKNGNLVGYYGGLEKKEFLLQLENKNKIS